MCDGAVPIFRNKPLAVIGGGDSAAEEATCESNLEVQLRRCETGLIRVDLTKYGSHVYVLVRKNELRASKIMAKRLTQHPKVTVLWNVRPFHIPFSHQKLLADSDQTVATECKGDGDLLQALHLKNLKTGEERDLPVNGLFYAIGHEPATALVKDQLHLDADGYIRTVPRTAQTSIKGVFAAGDVQDKKYRQAITSAGSGCMAALEAERLISEEEAEDPAIPVEEVHMPQEHYLGGDKE